MFILIILSNIIPDNSGDIHFDDDEKWTLESNIGVNLLQTAAHEIGHSLGLDHSRNEDSIMFAKYRGYRQALKLHEDDIQGVQDLYGKPVEANMEGKDLEETEQSIWRSCPGCEIM